MLTGTISAHQDILFLEAHDISADLMRLQIMLRTHLGAQYLHLIVNKINTIQNTTQIKHNFAQMEEELSEKTYESRLQYINARYLAYVDVKPQSEFVLLAIHEHLGLSNYFRVIVQALCNNQISIVIPNLFGEVMDNSNRSEYNDDESFLIKLNQSIIAQTLFDVFQSIKERNKKVIIVGLSIGSAIGLKMLQFLEGVEFAMFFYGFPPANLINPQKIKSRTIIYVGDRDKIKYLSDRKAVKQFKQKYEQNELIEIYEAQNLKHGFMNPASQNYNQEAFHSCCSQFQQLLHKLPKSAGEGKKKTKVKGQQNKNDNASSQSNRKGSPSEQNGQQQGGSSSKHQQQNKESSCQLI